MACSSQAGSEMSTETTCPCPPLSPVPVPGGHWDQGASGTESYAKTSPKLKNSVVQWKRVGRQAHLVPRCMIDSDREVKLQTGTSLALEI